MHACLATGPVAAAVVACNCDYLWRKCQCVRYPDVDLLSRASQDVQSLPSEKGTDFEARWLFIATWYNVSHYGLDFYPPVRLFFSNYTKGSRSSCLNYNTTFENWI